MGLRSVSCAGGTPLGSAATQEIWATAGLTDLAVLLDLTSCRVVRW